MGSFCSAKPEMIFSLVLAALIFGAGYVMVAMAWPPPSPPISHFEQNSSPNYDNNGMFAVNWTFNETYGGGDIAYYLVYTYNTTGGSLQIYNVTNTSSSNYYFIAGINGGNYTFNISAVSNTGIEGPNGTSSWMFVDTQSAAINLGAPADVNLTNSSTVVFNFTAIDNGSSTLNCSVNIDGSIKAWNASALNNTATNIAVSGIAGGTHQWNINCTDLATNTKASEARTLLVDLSAPAIVLNNPAQNSWQNPDNNVTFNYTPSDDLRLKNCSLYLTNAINQSFAYNQSNSSALINGSFLNSFSLNLSTIEESNYTWSVFCDDIAGRSNWAPNGTFYVGKKADLIISAIYLSNSSNVNSTRNPRPGDNITFDVEVTNVGTLPVSGTINVTFYWDDVYNGSSYFNSLSVGGAQNVTYTVLSDRVSSSKPYIMKAKVDEQGTVSESNESNNELSRIILTGLNVTIINITPSKPVPGQTLLINLSVMFFNGTPVAGLVLANFTSLLDVYTNGTAIDRTSSISGFANLGSGKYSFNITAAAKDSSNRADAGNHTFRIFVRYNTTTSTGVGEYYDNQWVVDNAVNSTSKQYELAAPNLAVTFDSASYSLDTRTETYKGFSFSIKNNGTSNINNITLTLTTSGTITLSKGNQVPFSQTFSCGPYPTLSPLTNSSFGSISDCSSAYTFNTTVTGTYYLTINAGGWNNGNSSDVYNATQATVTVVVTRSNSTSNSSSVSDESGDQSSSTPSTTYALTISNYNSTAYIEQGKSAILPFVVKNTGNGTINNISFSMALPSGLSWTNWYSVPALISKLVKQELMAVTTNLSVPANTSVGRYTITVKFSGKEASKTTTFVLQVLPGTGERTAINSSIGGFAEQILGLNDTLLSLADSNDNANLSVARNKLSRAKELLAEIQEDISRGDYLSAYETKKELENLLSEVRQILDAEKVVVDKKEKRSNTILLAAGAILAIAAFIYYSWMPEGYDAGSGAYNFRGKGAPIMERLRYLLENAKDMVNVSPRDVLEKLSEKSIQSKLLKGPKQVASYAYKPNTEVTDKLRKMQTTLTDQLKEYKTENQKPAYNYQKKEKWSTS